MNRPVLIVGGGPSGLSAAHALAAAGQRVVLVDKADQLGGAPILSGYAKLVPSGEWAKDAIGGMVKRVESQQADRDSSLDQGDGVFGLARKFRSLSLHRRQA